MKNIIFSFLSLTNFSKQVLVVTMVLFAMACGKNSYDESVANEQLIAFKKELSNQTEEISNAISTSIRQVASNQNNSFDLSRFKTAFDNAMLAKQGNNYNSTLQPTLKLWDIQTQSLESYLTENKVSQTTILEIQDIVSQMEGAARKLDATGLENESDLKRLSTEIKGILAHKETKCFKNKTLSDIEAKTIVTVTTVLSGTIDELLNLCTSYYVNDNSGLQMRGWFTSILKVVVNALVTAAVIVAVTVAVAAVIYFTAGAAGVVIAGATSFSAFLGSAGVIGGTLAAIRTSWMGCNGFCAIQEDMDYRCFCR